MTTRTHTTRAHERSFETAPRVHRGVRVRVLKNDDQFPGWFFGACLEGQEGYFPMGWFELSPDGSAATARRDYDAAELTIEVGVGVECIETEAGWLLVRTADGREGWIPEDCVK